MASKTRGLFSALPTLVAAIIGWMALSNGFILAQSFTGGLTGTVRDASGASVPEAALTVKHLDTGLTRTTVTDGNGSYLQAALPIGRYDVTVSLSGFATVELHGVIVDVGAVVRADFQLRVAAVRETVNVTAASPLVQTASPVVGGVVERRRIEELPLNGRQFANLAATLPGVGIGFHRDPTKSSQYMPQVGGGFGRNMSIVVDGSDNNDDTVGGQLQGFPLDAIEEFRFSIASYAADQGRAAGGVMQVVTKSGTNQVAGSLFDLTRDDALNVLTESERRAGVAKPDYRRWQYGGSIGGPLVVDRVHAFAAVERVQQNTFQAVDTQGLFPALNGVFPVEYRESLLTTKLTLNTGAADRVAIRYAWNATSQPQGAGPRVPPEAWGDNRNRLHSLNANYSRVLGAGAFNELIVQYATFENVITAATDRSTETFPNGVIIGRAPSAPQETRQRKLHLRDDVSWHVAGRRGVSHDFKAGGVYEYEPTLGLPSLPTPPGQFSYTHLTNELNGPLTGVGGNAGAATIDSVPVNIPMTRAGGYLQDNWRVTNRLTVDAGVRYDVIIGYQIDQSRNPNFVAMQNAGRSGRLNGMIGFEDFGQDPKNDLNNIQPRLGFAFDVRGNGNDVVRGGWGTYSDSAFINGNVLFAASDAEGPQTSSFFGVSDPQGIRKPDGTFYRVGDPISSIAGLNQAGTTGLGGEIVSPRLEQPFTRQASIGWTHQLGATSAFNVDYIHADGRDLNLRLRLNTRPNLGPTRLSDLPLDPNSQGFRFAISRGTSQYDALLLSVRRRTLTGIDVAASYALSRAKSLYGGGVDETGLGPPGSNGMQDATDPFAPVNFGPTAADARHRVSLSAIVPVGWGVQVAPLFFFRSALPVATIEGVDRNRDAINNDIPDRAFAFDGVGRPPTDMGACLTFNCGRGAPFSQLNVRVSKRFALPRGSRFEVIGEVFNLFNALNPGVFSPRRLLGTTPNAEFMQPTVFAGDFQQPEQRVGQIGVRWMFGR